MPIQLKSFTQISTELRRLRILALASRFAFETTKTVVRARIHSGTIDPKQPVTIKSDSKVIVSDTHYHLLNKLQFQIPRYVRETVFVRIISTLEVFLVDVIRDIFLHRTDLFYSQNRSINLTYGEILSCDDISRIRNKVLSIELRQLHSKGLREIAKYYEGTLGLRFSEITSHLDVLWEMIDRRHLLVHRLGRADEAYRHKYNYRGKGALSADDTYLKEALDLIEQFSAALKVQVAEILSSKISVNEDSDRVEIEIEVETASEEGERAVAPEFPFVVNDRKAGEHGAKLADILAYRRRGQDERKVLVLNGSRETVNSYISELKKRQRKGLLSVVRKEVLMAPGVPLGFRSSSLDRQALEAIALSLPPEPWPAGLHKDIAARLRISNSEASRALRTISSDESLRSLVAAGDPGSGGGEGSLPNDLS